MAPETRRSTHESQKRAPATSFELSALDPLERVLLVSDGTLTDMLAALYLENIDSLLLDQRIHRATRRIDLLRLQEGELVLERQVLFRGNRSHRAYAYADSLVAVDRLAPVVRETLLRSISPLAQIWKQSGTESFKQVLLRDREAAGELCEHFDAGPDSSLLIRVYRAHAGGQPVALIKEYIEPPPARGSGAPPAGGLTNGQSARPSAGARV
jgi:chorismate-pyruvate lyase